jgi:hypothetical protein
MDIPDDAVVVRVRIVVHTMGSDGWDESTNQWDKSENHWSLYLVLAGETTSVRLNMSLADLSDNDGTFSVTAHQYILSNSSLMHFDYISCNVLTVRHYLNLISGKQRQNYRMTETGNGCRFWM